MSQNRNSNINNEAVIYVGEDLTLLKNEEKAAATKLKSNNLSKVTIPITGAPSQPRERAEELFQFIGGITPLHAYTNVMSGQSYTSAWKVSTIQAVMAGFVKLPSNAGRELEYESNEKKAGGKGGNLQDLTVSFAMKPWKAIKFIYGSLLPVPRRAEDAVATVITGGLPVVNTLIQAVGVTAEIALKVPAAALTHPINLWFRKRAQVAAKYKFELDNWNWAKRIGVEVGFLAGSVFPLIPWVVGQAAFSAANVISYARKAVDAVTQTVSSAISLITSPFHNRYGTVQPGISVPIKTLAKNIVLGAGLGLPLVSGIVNSAVIKVRQVADKVSAYFKKKDSANPSPSRSDPSSTHQINRSTTKDAKPYRGSIASTRGGNDSIVRNEYEPINNHSSDDEAKEPAAINNNINSATTDTDTDTVSNSKKQEFTKSKSVGFNTELKFNDYSSNDDAAANQSLIPQDKNEKLENGTSSKSNSAFMNAMVSDTGYFSQASTRERVLSAPMVIDTNLKNTTDDPNAIKVVKGSTGRRMS